MDRGKGRLVRSDCLWCCRVLGVVHDSNGVFFHSRAKCHQWRMDESKKGGGDFRGVILGVTRDSNGNVFFHYRATCHQWRIWRKTFTTGEMEGERCIRRMVTQKCIYGANFYP